MIDRDSLVGFGERDGLAVVTFSDGRELRYVPEWRGDSVRRITEVMLLQGNDVIARVEGGHFWSNRGISQQGLGKYCAFAIELERDVYRRYRTKKIEEGEWQENFRIFWKISIKNRQIVATLEQGTFQIKSENGEI